MNQPLRPNDGPTLIALFFMILAAFGLLGLTTMVLPQIAGFVVVGGAFFFICIFHYLVWGRFMKIPPEETTPEDEQE